MENYKHIKWSEFDKYKWKFAKINGWEMFLFQHEHNPDRWGWGEIEDGEANIIQYEVSQEDCKRNAYDDAVSREGIENLEFG